MAENRSRSAVLPHVALIVETATAYGRAILSGISQYVRERGPWTLKKGLAPWKRYVYY